MAFGREKAAQTRKENTMKNPDRLTPEEIIALREDKRNALKQLRKRARIIVDTGGGHSATPPTPPTPPATPGK